MTRTYKIVYVLSPSPAWTDGFLVGRYPSHMGLGMHLVRDHIHEVQAIDTVFIIGGWDTGLTREQRVLAEKALHDSGAELRNGAGMIYDWGTPRPWDIERSEAPSDPQGPEGNTHRAVIETSVPPGMTVIAAGPMEFCETSLATWVRHHPLDEYETALVMAIQSKMSPSTPTTED